jgi:GAF domain-containing protein
VALFDSGRPVGSIEARHSIRTPVVFTVLLGILSLFLGTLIYVIFRTYPIKKLDSTLADLQRAEEEQRRSRETAERLAGETAVIADIGRLIGSTLDIEEVYERFAAEARKLIPFDRLAINLYNFQENTSHVAYVSGLSISDRKPGSFVALAGTFSEELIRTQTSLLFQPASIDEIGEIVARFPPLSATFQAGLLSLMGIPLVYRNEAIGVLHFRSKKPNAYTERDLRLAERIGAQIAGAIANAQLLDNLERSAKEMAVIAEIGRLIGSTLDIDGVYERFAAEARKLIPFDRIVINIIDVEMNTVTNVYMAGHGITDRIVGVRYPLKGSGNFEMVRTKSSLLIQTEDFDEYNDRFPMLLSTFQAGFRSIMNIPLLSKGEVVGGLFYDPLNPTPIRITM